MRVRLAAAPALFLLPAVAFANTDRDFWRAVEDCRSTHKTQPALALCVQGEYDFHFGKKGEPNDPLPEQIYVPSDLCPNDEIVWVNTRTSTYYFWQSRYFGSTKNGRYMCERNARREGNRPDGTGPVP